MFEQRHGKSKQMIANRVLQNFSELFIGRSANNTHDMKQLVLVVSTAEERNSRNHLGENATTRPNIDRCTIRP